MKKIILKVEPSTIDNINKTYTEMLTTYNDRLNKWRSMIPTCQYDKSVREQIIQETQKEIQDLRLHHSILKQVQP